MRQDRKCLTRVAPVKFESWLDLLFKYLGMCAQSARGDPAQLPVNPIYE